MSADDTTQTFSFSEQAQLARAGALYDAQKALHEGKPPSVVVDELGHTITSALCHLHFETLKRNG